MNKIKVTCPFCGTTQIVELTDEELKSYNEYKNNRNLNIQDIFPNFSADKRELLISGICSRCWNSIFKDVK